MAHGKPRAAPPPYFVVTAPLFFESVATSPGAGTTASVRKISCREIEDLYKGLWTLYCSPETTTVLLEVPTMAGNAASVDRHRKTVFPRSDPSNHSPAVKRVFAEQDNSKDAQKLRRMIPVKSKPGFLGSLRAPTTLPKEEVNPWERYQACMKLDQAGPGYAAYAKNSSFEELIVKEVGIHNRKSLARISSVNHTNIVKLHEALYYEGSIYLCYEIMDITLAQVFGTPLGSLNHYEVAAFCKEILEGLNYIHNSLQIAHGDLSSKNVLLSAGTANVKIGTISLLLF